LASLRKSHALSPETFRRFDAKQKEKVRETASLSAPSCILDRQMVYPYKIQGTLTICVQVQFGKKSALLSDTITPGKYCSAYGMSGKKNGTSNME